MADIVSSLVGSLNNEELPQSLKKASKPLLALIEPDSYVGEVYSLGYAEALVQIHDYHRQQVGGIPALSFLIATRIKPDEVVDVRREDSAVILLRVLIMLTFRMRRKHYA